MTYDVAILGAGPGGHEAALEAAALGLSTALVERAALGGTCLNRGCIPTKLFLGATAAAPELEAARRLKLADGSIAFDLPAIQTRKERFIKGSRQAVAAQCKNAGITLVQGAGRIAAPGELEVAGPEGTVERVAYRHLIVATGSRPATFPGLAADGGAVLDSDQLLDLATPPESLIVVGGGAIGLEMAEFLFRLGTAITIVEGQDRLAPTEDPEVGTALAKAHKRRGWTILTGAQVASLTTADGTAVLRLDSGEELTASKALLAVGRRPNTEGVGLAAAGVGLSGPGEAGWIATNEHLEAAPGIYAIGDANGRTLLAHAASHQGRYAARRIAGRESGPYAPPAMPSCVYGTVEAMRAGPTARQLVDAGKAVAASESQLVANPIAQAHGAAHGFVRVLWTCPEGAAAPDEAWTVAGIMAVGHGVSHLVTQAVLMVEAGWTARDARRIIFAHPTLDEALAAALAAPRTPVVTTT
ncbi:MAG: NAD(P)/FAD-dependent oxidoreductase [Desulfovibrionaceae bacterium]